jgi:hypothetical protein
VAAGRRPWSACSGVGRAALAGQVELAHLPLRRADRIRLRVARLVVRLHVIVAAAGGDFDFGDLSAIAVFDDLGAALRRNIGGRHVAARLDALGVGRRRRRLGGLRGGLPGHGLAGAGCQNRCKQRCREFQGGE